MRWLLKCCYCISLRVGCLASGAWTLFTATLMGALQVYNIMSMQNLTSYQIKHGLIGLQNAKVLALLEIVFAITLALLSLLLFLGVIKDRLKLLLPYIIGVATYQVFDLSTLIFYIGKDVQVYPSVWIPDVMIMCINIYCVFVVLSFYKELSRTQRWGLREERHQLHEEQSFIENFD